jgi:hypothetical protein
VPTAVTVVADAALREKLLGLTGPADIIDESGRKLGRFTPEPAATEPLCPWDPSLTPEKIDQMLETEGGLTLAEIFRKLEGDGRLRRPPVDEVIFLRSEGGTFRRALEKDPAILQVLERLAARLGPKTFDIVDHWDCDLTAVGVANPKDHRILAYISTFGMPEGRYIVELELPPEPGRKLPYHIAHTQSGLDFEQLVAKVRTHLARDNS